MVDGKRQIGKSHEFEDLDKTDDGSYMRRKKGVDEYRNAFHRHLHPYHQDLNRDPDEVIIAESSEALEKGLDILSSEEKQRFSTQLEEASTKLRFALHQWREARRALNDNASDDQLTGATDNLNRVREDFASLKEEIVKKIEQNSQDHELNSLKEEIVKKREQNLKDLDQRCRDILYDYQKAGAQALKLGLQEVVHSLRQSYTFLYRQFKDLKTQAGKSYAPYYAQCQGCLDQMQATLESCRNKINAKVEEIGLKNSPVAQRVVSQAMKKIIEDADYVNDKLSNNMCKINSYNPEARQDQFEQVSQVTLKGLIRSQLADSGLNADKVARMYEIDGSDPQNIFKDLKQLADKCRQARKCCEKVSEIETRARTSLDYMKPILERLEQSGMLPANTFDQAWIGELQDRQRSAFLEGAAGEKKENLLEGEDPLKNFKDALKNFENMASVVHQASECCKEVSVVEAQVRSDVDSIRRILEEHKLNDMLYRLAFSDAIQDCSLEHRQLVLVYLDKTFGDQLLQELGDAALQEGAQGTKGQAVDNLDQCASKVGKAKEDFETLVGVVTQVRNHIDDIKKILARHGIANELDKTFGNDLEQKLRNVWLARTQDTKGQAFDNLHRFASDVGKAKEDCETVDRVVTRVRRHIADIEKILARHGIANELDKTFGGDLEQKLRNVWLARAQGTKGQAFDNLNQLASDVGKAKEDCETVEWIVSQLKESQNLQQGFSEEEAFLEAAQGRSDRPDFKVIERNLEKEMQEQFDIYQGKIEAMTSTYECLIINYEEKLKVAQIDQEDLQSLSKSKSDLFWLKHYYEKFKKLGEGIREKSGDERTKENRTLMGILSEIEKLTQSLEQSLEKQIDRRFEIQTYVATNPYKFFIPHPNHESIVKSHQEACKIFENMRKDIRKRSGSTKTQGHTVLGRMLNDIEELEGRIAERLIKEKKPLNRGREGMDPREREARERERVERFYDYDDYF